jgi:hypothetical protein
MSRREEKGPKPGERERIARILKTAFPVGGAGSFTSLLHTLDLPGGKNARK